MIAHMPGDRVTGLFLLAWVAGGIVAGVLVHFLVLRPLVRVAGRRNWTAVATVAAVTSTVVVLWGALAGLYIGLDGVLLPAHSQLFVNRTIVALAVLSATWVVARLCSTAVGAYGRHTDHRMFSISLYSSVVEAAILAVGLLTVLSTFGVSIAPLLTTMGLGGLAVALALRDTLANLFSGMQIVASRQIRPGDYVKFDFGVEGEVVDIQWRNTTVRDQQRDVVVVPNEKIVASVFTNYSSSGSEFIVPVAATLAWKGPAQQLETIAERAAREAAGAKSRVALTALNETNVQITAYLDVRDVTDRQRAAADFLRRLHDGALDAAGTPAT